MSKTGRLRADLFSFYPPVHVRRPLLPETLLEAKTRQGIGKQNFSTPRFSGTRRTRPLQLRSDE